MPAAEHPTTGGRPPDPESRDEYVRAVQAAMADGVLDAADRTSLEEVREELLLSEHDAALLEAQTKDAFTSCSPEQEAGGSAGPACLEINDGHCYVEGHVAVLDIRVTCTCDQALEDVLITAAGQQLGQAETPPLKLEPRQCARQMLQVEPQRAGEHVLNLTLRYTHGGKTEVFTAQTLFKVFGRSENPANFMLVLDQRMEAAQKIGYGLSIRNELKEGFARGLIRDTNDLLRQKHAERWQIVPLIPTDPLRRPVPTIASLMQRGPALERASLFLLDNDGERRVHLLSGAEVRLGRKRGLNDIVLRCFPRTAENDRRSRLISRAPHLTLALRNGGLFICEHGSPNGTYVDGIRLEGESPLPQQGSVKIEVGQALTLRLTTLSQSDPGFDAMARYDRLGPPDAVRQTAEQLGVRGVLIQRLDSVGRAECHIVVYSWADLEADCYSSGAKRRAVPRLRVIRAGGGLWAESREAGGQLLVDGVAVPSGGVFALASGLRIRCETVDARVETLQQFGFDSERT